MQTLTSLKILNPYIQILKMMFSAKLLKVQLINISPPCPCQIPQQTMTDYYFHYAKEMLFLHLIGTPFYLMLGFVIVMPQNCQKYFFFMVTFALAPASPTNSGEENGTFALSVIRNFQKFHC